MMRARRTCLPPTRRGLSEILLEDLGDADQQLWPGQSAAHPIPAAVFAVVVRIEVVIELAQRLIGHQALGDAECQTVQTVDRCCEDRDASDGLRALQILKNGAGRSREPLGRHAQIEHESNAIAPVPRFVRSRRRRNSHREAALEEAVLAGLSRSTDRSVAHRILLIGYGSALAALVKHSAGVAHDESSVEAIQGARAGARSCSVVLPTGTVRELGPQRAAHGRPGSGLPFLAAENRSSTAADTASIAGGDRGLKGGV